MILIIFFEFEVLENTQNFHKIPYVGAHAESQAGCLWVDCILGGALPWGSLQSPWKAPKLTLADSLFALEGHFILP